jgi:ABC-type amino acid transport substrate-binding protein
VNDSLSAIVSYEETQDRVLLSLDTAQKGISESMGNFETTKETLRKIVSTVSEGSDRSSAVSNRRNGIAEDSINMANSSRYVLSSLSYQRDIVEEMELYIQHEKEKCARAVERDRSVGIQEKPGRRTCLAGHDSAYPPWVFVSKGAASGISVSVFSSLCKEADLTPSFSPGQWCTLFPELLDGQLDCLLNVGWPSAYFDSQPVIASLPYASFQTMLFAHKRLLSHAGAFDVNSLSGKRIAVQRGSFMHQFLAPFHCEIVEYENDIQSMVNHIWNRVDAVCVEREVGKFLSKRFFQEDIVPVSESLGKKDVVLLFRKDNEELRDRFNEVIAKRVQ